MSSVQQAGAVAWRPGKTAPEFLVVTARRTPDHWLFPKGHLEPGEEADACALRELREEAGVTGTLDDPEPLGRTTYPFEGREKTVTWFLIRATDEAATGERRIKSWLPYDAARRLLTFADTRPILDEARQRLDR